MGNNTKDFKSELKSLGILKEENGNIGVSAKLMPDERRVNKPPFLLSYYELYGNSLKDHPSTFSIPISKGITLDFIETLENEGFEIFWEDIDFDLNADPKFFPTTILLKNDKLKSVINIYTAWVSEKSDKQTDLTMLEKCKSANKVVSRNTKRNNINYLYISVMNVLVPSKQNRDTVLLNSLLEKFEGVLKKDDIKEDTKSTKIHMMVKDDYGMDFTDFDISKSTPKMDNLDLIYGEGFDEYNKKLLKRLEDEKKGVVLLHGEPGTGKTYYIRALLQKLTEINKRVIYIPPSMVETMADPGMVGFLTNNIINEERDTILLIEDAEPLLQSRTDGNIRTTGITNLLNSTDGILNDILGLVVICTFNTDLQNIDDALLRPGRLLARKEFNKISSDRVKDVAKALGVSDNLIENDKDYTIAELSNLKAKSKTLIHDYDEQKDNYRKIGFGNR